jgi:L-ascorbate metabolism protein UlaG (beta-lactamase superfamily)
MAIKFTWLGHSAFALDIDDHPILIDPFLTGNPLAAANPDELKAEIIFLSHAHGDHLGDTVDIAKRTGAKVVTNFEIANWLNKQGVENTHGQIRAAATITVSSTPSSRARTTVRLSRTGHTAVIHVGSSCRRGASGCILPGIPTCSVICN